MITRIRRAVACMRGKPTGAMARAVQLRRVKATSPLTWSLVSRRTLARLSNRGEAEDMTSVRERRS